METEHSSAIVVEQSLQLEPNTKTKSTSVPFVSGKDEKGWYLEIDTEAWDNAEFIEYVDGYEIYAKRYQYTY